MDGKEPPLKPRRPLPRQPSQSSVNVVAPAPFYGPQPPPAQRPPPLPTRSQNPGSSRTIYQPPASPPPSYARAEASPFREPELITEEPVSSQDAMPGLEPTAWYGYDAQPDWAGSGGATWGDANVWQHTSGGDWPATGFDNAYVGAGGFTAKLVEIDGRDFEEEINWWKPEVRGYKSHPGPGILPPLLTESLHNPEHSLLHVLVESPDLRPREFLAARTDSITSNSSTSNASGSSGPSQSTLHPPQSSSPPPSDKEVRTAVPHPHAYYCRKHNGWVIVIIRSSSVLPPLARSFLRESSPPALNQARRRKTSSCIEDGERSAGQANKTHHFHLYQRAVDAHKLNPPFYRSGWESSSKIKEKRRQGMASIEEADLERLQHMEDDPSDTGEPEGDLLNLYICCQCSTYCIASGVIPGIIQPKYIEEFTRERQENSRVGPAAVVIAWDTILKIIESKLWKGENRSLPVSSSAFQQKLGWSSVLERIFYALGFTISEISLEDRRIGVYLPSVDVSMPESKLYRAKLLRAWVEINAWLADYIRCSGKSLGGVTPHRLCVKVENVREHYQRELGAHAEQLPRGVLSHALMSYHPISNSWLCLGLTPTTYTPELLIFAYLAQCRCDPANTIEYFSQIFNIVKAMQDLGEVPPAELQSLIMEERSRNRFTFEDYISASRTLGFGRDGPLGLDFEDDIEDEFIANAWRDAVRRAWRDPENASALLRDAHEAFRILAETRGSTMLRHQWETGSVKMMTPERAYDVLEVPKDVDESMLLTVFTLRFQEQPAQSDKWKEALSIIAESRDSERLRQFLESGRDPGDTFPPAPQDLPRGLNQLGNTCYLNSLLQYFYTIKELREAVAPMANSDAKTVEDDKFTDDDLKRHRVGGRMVTRREITRARKFVSHLADLFWQLEYCEATAVTPELELAKLALVTSRDEEEDDADKGGTDASNDTDATLVEDVPARASSAPEPVPPTSRSPSSVLGKRPRDSSQHSDAMEVDNVVTSSPQEKDGFMIISHPSSPTRVTTTPAPEQAGPSNHDDALASSPHENGGDFVMRDVPLEMGPQVPPIGPQLPLPAKKTTSDSVMMFGRQHDVSECMDNCMFQIETALLKFDEMSGEQSSKTSVVKRLFYGKIRQRISVAAPNQQSRFSVHEKEDIFSHLPVNVAEDGVDLYNGLSCYFDDIIEFENKKARMEVSLVDLPPLLQIQLQRVQFNRETLQPYKSQAYVKFGETIFMDRFLADVDPNKKARSKTIQADLSACRDRIHLLTHETHAPFDLALDHTADFLADPDATSLLEVEEDFVLSIRQEQERMKAELIELRARAISLKQELEDVWRDDKAAAYELTSVFVHRGSSPSWGHYFFYSRHLPHHPDMWFKYNDSEVSKVSKEEVLADTTGSTANPYLLVFARKGSEVVDTVKRFDPTRLEEV